jgi:hypothetical protein
MTISRRNFLMKTTMTGISAVAAFSFAESAFGQSYGYKKNPRPEFFEVPAEAYDAVLYSLNMRTFVGLINQTFVIYHPEKGKMEMYLKEVEDLRPPAFKNNTTTRSECFNLVFVSQSEIVLPQGTYMMGHDKLGMFDIFIVPGSAQRYGRNYGAAFNRLYP